MEDLVLVRVSRVSSNGNLTLIYLGKEIVEKLGLTKGTRVALKIDPKKRLLVVEKLPDL